MCSKLGCISERHILKAITRVVKALFNLKDKVISWPDAQKQLYESMLNDEREGFIGAVGKVDGTNIDLKFKPGGTFKGEPFFTRKKRYSMDLYAICDFSKQFNV